MDFLGNAFKTAKSLLSFYDTILEATSPTDESLYDIESQISPSEITEPAKLTKSPKLPSVILSEVITRLTDTISTNDAILKAIQPGDEQLPISTQASIACDNFLCKDESVFYTSKQDQKCDLCDMTFAAHLYRIQNRKEGPCSLYKNDGSNFCSQCSFNYSAHKK